MSDDNNPGYAVLAHYLANLQPASREQAIREHLELAFAEGAKPENRRRVPRGPWKVIKELETRIAELDAEVDRQWDRRVRADERRRKHYARAEQNRKRAARLDALYQKYREEALRSRGSTIRREMTAQYNREMEAVKNALYNSFDDLIFRLRVYGRAWEGHWAPEGLGLGDDLAAIAATARDEHLANWRPDLIARAQTKAARTNTLEQAAQAVLQTHGRDAYAVVEALKHKPAEGSGESGGE